MDELKIVTDFTKNLVAKLIKKELGYDVDIKLHELTVTITEEKATAHLSIDVEIGNDELKRLCENVVSKKEPLIVDGH